MMQYRILFLRNCYHATLLYITWFAILIYIDIFPTLRVLTSSYKTLNCQLTVAYVFSSAVFETKLLPFFQTKFCVSILRLSKIITEYITYSIEHVLRVQYGSLLHFQIQHKNTRMDCCILCVKNKMYVCSCMYLCKYRS